jgi:ABC-2 type transport system permease protein
MNVFLRELRYYRKSTVIWAMSLSLGAVIFLLMYPAFTKDVAASKSTLANIPAALREVVGISLQNFFTIFGFYSYLLTFIGLGAAVQAMNLGVGVISKEESGKTADFILSKPISRASLITSKLLAALSLIIFSNGVFIAVSYVAALMVTDVAFRLTTFLLIALSVFLVQIVFLSIGAACAVTISKIKSVISVTLPTVFGLFIVGSIGAVLGNENIRYVSPFKFYDTNYIINHSGYEMKYLIIEALVVIAAVAATYLIFIKKDIRAAS